MKRILYFTLFVTQIAFSQNLNEYHRYYSDSLPGSYQLNHAGIREDIFSKFPPDFRTDKKARSCYQFSDLVAVHVADEMESGHIYSDWNELEKYLNDIVKLLLPEELITKESIHVYVSKDGSINASSLPSGTIFFNVGLLPYMRSEAGLAAVLAHEVAHYYFNHVIQRYLNDIYGKYDYVFFNDSKARNKFSVNNELEADSMGMVWMLKAGYSIDGMLEANNVIYRIQKNQLRRVEENFEMEETTHPSGERRIKKINEYKEKNKIGEGKYYIVGEATFNQLKHESRCEVLNSLLESLNYTACLENAFIYHLFEPDNNIYIYYIIEGIRRYCYFDKVRWKKNFITDNYYVNVDLDGHKKKLKMESHLLEKFDLEILPIDPNDGMKIKTKDYWRGEPEFKTYNEAFSYFCRLGMDLNNPECILSNALSFGNDTSKRNKLLDSYLSFMNIKHRDYALALRKDSLFASLPKMNLNIISDYQVNVLQGSKKINLGRSLNDKSGIIYTTAMRSVYSDSVNKTLLLYNFKSTNLNDFRTFKKMEELSLSRHMLINKDLDLSYIDPSFWELFKKYESNKIIFNRITFTTAIAGDNSLKGIRNVLAGDHKTMWFETNDVKYFSLLESRFTITKNSFMNEIAFCEDYKLKRTDTTQAQLEKLFKTKQALHFYSATALYIKNGRLYK